MTRSVRFGRKIPVPSTIEIKHDLRLMATADALVAARAGQGRGADEAAAIVGELAAAHGLSRDRATMLVARLGLGRDTLKGAAQGSTSNKV